VPYPTDRESDRLGDANHASSPRLTVSGWGKAEGLSVASDLPEPLRPGRRAGQGRGGKVGVPVTTSATCARCSTASAGRREHLDATMRRPCGCSRWYSRWRRSRRLEAADPVQVRASSPAPRRTTSQGVPVPGYLRVPAGPQPAPATDLVTWTVTHVPRWNPINICPVPLQEAGPPRCRRSPTRCHRHPCWLRSLRPVRRRSSARSSRASRSSSTPGCGSSRCQDARVRRAVGRDHPGTATA